MEAQVPLLNAQERTYCQNNEHWEDSRPTSFLCVGLASLCLYNSVYVSVYKSSFMCEEGWFAPDCSYITHKSKTFEWLVTWKLPVFEPCIIKPGKNKCSVTEQKIYIKSDSLSVWTVHQCQFIKNVISKQK